MPLCWEQVGIQAVTPGGVIALVHRVDLALTPGRTHALVGESGSGKSITALAAMRLLPLDMHVRGRITFEGVEIRSMTLEQMRKLRGNRVAAAGCVFPLTQQEGLSTSLGLRHRAAIGLSEETDAVIVVVSEETGEISIAQGGRLVQGLDADGLRAYLTAKLMPALPRRPRLVDWLRRYLAGLVTSRPGTEGGSDQGFAGGGPAGPGRSGR